jgi:hypothetical protein
MSAYDPKRTFTRLLNKKPRTMPGFFMRLGSLAAATCGRSCLRWNRPPVSLSGLSGLSVLAPLAFAQVPEHPSYGLGTRR